MPMNQVEGEPDREIVRYANDDRVSRASMQGAGAMSSV